MLWSFFERLAPRISSSLLLLILAVLVAPEVVGVYSWGALFYTAYQAVSDTAARQIVISAVSTNVGLRFLKGYRVIAAICGVSLLTLAILALYRYLPNMVSAEALLLFPIALAPICAAAGIISVGRLQAANQWRLLASGQGIAALASFAVALPVLLVSGSILGCSLALLVSELTFALWCRSQSKGLEEATGAGQRLLFKKSFAHMAMYSGLGWFQGQADRLLIGLISGPAQLGAFSMASALARSLGEALAASNANLLRAELGVQEKMKPGQIRRAATRILNRGLSVTVLLVVVSVVLTDTVIDHFLGPEWDEAIEIVPIIALCSFPSLLSWSSAALHVASSSSGRAVFAQVIAIFFALPVALLATHDLVAASWMVVAREVTRCTVSWALLGRTAPWRSFSLMILYTGVFAIIFSAV